MKADWDTLLKVVITLFGAYIIYQLIRVIFGGSWSTEEIIVALLVLNLSVTFLLAKKIEAFAVELKHIRGSFEALATDFKALRADYHSHVSKYHKR